MTHISIRKLQKISGDAIGTLPGPTSVKSGDRKVGLLIPLKAANPDHLAAVLARAASLARDRDTAVDEAALADMGIDPTDLVGRSGAGARDLTSLSAMKPPSPTLVLDAAILISAALGRSAGAIMFAQQAAVLVTTDRVVQEARRRLELGLKRPELLPLIDDLAAAITVVPAIALEALVPPCEQSLRDTVASRNGSIRDAHVLALAWSVEGDIWTADRDFAGAGVATWSTPNLMRGFIDALC
jgi:predicted nucleic acid-binding protein